MLSTWWLVVNTAALGAVLGAAVALLGYVITQGRRSFAADGAVRAARYEVVVDADLADRAVRMLHPADPEGELRDAAVVDPRSSS